jgi:hypothetical protein
MIAVMPSSNVLAQHAEMDDKRIGFVPRLKKATRFT